MIVVIVLVIIAIVVVVLLVLWMRHRKPKKGLYSPTHYNTAPAANPYDSMELKYKDVTSDNNDMRKEMEANLSAEVVAEEQPVSVPVAPVEGILYWIFLRPLLLMINLIYFDD